MADIISKVKIKKEKGKSEVIEEISSSKPQALNSKHSTHSPQTMEELLSLTGYNLKGVKKGDVVEGAITRVSPKEITIDIAR